MNDEAQFPTPISATLTFGIFFWHLAWHVLVVLSYKKLRKSTFSSYFICNYWRVCFGFCVGFYH